MAKGAPAGNALNVVVGKVMDGLARQCRILFETFAPPNETLAQNHVWLAAAYHNWWASDAHVFAHIVYTILTIYAILIILHFEVVGSSRST